MVVNRKYMGRAKSPSTGIAIGVLVSAILMMIATGLLANLLECEVLQWENVGYGIMMMLLVSAFSGAWVACGQVKGKPLLISTATGMGYFLVLIAVTALFFGGQYDGVWVTICLVMGASTAAGITRLGEKRGGKMRKGQIAYR